MSTTHRYDLNLDLAVEVFAPDPQAAMSPEQQARQRQLRRAAERRRRSA